jgi:hypothetical protein
MSQSVVIAVGFPGVAAVGAAAVLAELMATVVAEGLKYEEQQQLETEDGIRHEVDLVVRDEQGAKIGVKVDEKQGKVRFVGHDGSDRRASALAGRVLQRYAYSRVMDDLKRKGYQIAKEERQADGSIKLVAQRWR